MFLGIVLIVKVPPDGVTKLKSEMLLMKGYFFNILLPTQANWQHIYVTIFWLGMALS